MLATLMFFSGSTIYAQGADQSETTFLQSRSLDKYRGKDGYDLLRYRMMIMVKIIYASNDHIHLGPKRRTRYELLRAKPILTDEDWTDVIDIATKYPTAVESEELIDRVLDHADPQIKTKIRCLEGMGSKDGPPKKHAILSGIDKVEYDQLLKKTALSKADAKKAEALCDKCGKTLEGYVLFDHQLLYRPDEINPR